MAKDDNRPKARLPRGFADRTAGEIRATDAMLSRIKAVYERYGFEPVETPLVEYTEALGKFLPDQDRPNEGVFSFQDDDERWLSLRYDLTAPLARYVAENFERLPKPFRSYRAGWVLRNEKPGPGRFRQFMQFDADTVGAASPAADAEMCMMMADAIEAAGIPRGQYVIKVNSRKVLDGVMEAIGLSGAENAGRRLQVLRAIDKLDRLGVEGVRALLGEGRRDESGDFTKGARLVEKQIDIVLSYLKGAGETWTSASNAAPLPTDDEWIRRFNEADTTSPINDDPRGLRVFYDQSALIDRWENTVASTVSGSQGTSELRSIIGAVRAAGYGSRRIRVNAEIVRGLEYYTGPVFEAELLFDVPNEKGETVVFGSVGGGGRYDGLVGRFRGEDVPATGFSIGVSRLMAALTALKRVDVAEPAGPVVVTVMDRERIADMQRLVAELRNSGIAAELYLGSSGMKAQLKYADRRNAPIAVIQGEDERARGVVQLKDLALGKELAAAIADNTAWRGERPGQVEVPAGELVSAVRDILNRQTRG
ncbi:MAG: histidine--tRNA ligase [Bauldia sp.]|nr:histidine--tRNA ligase [Bauldia sp.]